jgi:flagellar hook-length control protein FliK
MNSIPAPTPAPAATQSPAVDAPSKAASKGTPKSTPKSTPKTAPNSGPKDASTAATNDASNDDDTTAAFALALAQTANAAPPPATATTPAKGTTSDDAPSDAELAALQSAWISMPIPQQLPTDPQTTIAMRAAQGDEGVDLLQAVSQKAGNDVLALLDELAGASDRESGATDAHRVLEAPTMPTLPIAQADSRTQSSAVTEAQTKPLHTPVGTQAWADELGNRVTLLATGGHQSASLKLNPEHLGPLEVRISIRDDQASVWFGAAHADTRAAIEHALPRLREQFASQGLSLTDAGVFREPPRDNSRRTSSGNGVGNHQDAAAESLAVVVRRFGLVDAYV